MYIKTQNTGQFLYQTSPDSGFLIFCKNIHICSRSISPYIFLQMIIYLKINKLDKISTKISFGIGEEAAATRQ